MAEKLNARKVETLTEPGRYSDGDNLYLFITPNGGKRWTFLYRLSGKRREMGHHDGQNPAAWRGHLKSLLPARQKFTRGHPAALAL